MAGGNTYFRVGTCFLGPNPYASEPVVRIVWSDGFLADPSLTRGLAPMSKATDPMFAPPIASNDSAQDGKLRIADWLTRWSHSLLIARRGHLNAQGTRRENGEIVSWIGYHNVRLTLETIAFAARHLKAFSAGGTAAADFGAHTKTLLKHCHARHPDFQAKFLMTASDAMGIPYQPVAGAEKTWQYGWGRNAVISLETGLAENSSLFARIAGNKPATKDVFRALGLPCGREIVVETSEELGQVPQRVGYPCVTKPVNGMQSRNVTIGITDPDTLLVGFEHAQELNGGPVIVEQMMLGDVYRLVAFHGEFFCAIRRTPPILVGDGLSTVARLLEKKEAERLADPVRSRFVGGIPLDDVLFKRLQAENLTLQSIPEKGRKVRLRDVPRSTKGAVFRDVTDQTHPHVKAMAITLSKAMRLPSVGIDYVTTDITQPPTATCGFIEVNSIPSLILPLAAGIGIERCAEAVLGGRAARIPSGLTVMTSERMTGLSGRPVDGDNAGWVRGHRCGIGDIELRVPHASTCECARAVVRNPLAHSVEIEMTFDELVRNGLPLDRFDRVRIAGGDVAPPPEWVNVLETASAAPLVREAG